MINILFLKKNNLLHSFELKGHAEYVDEDGITVYDDVVCGVASALPVSIINGMTEILKIYPKVNVSEGDICIDLQSLKLEEIKSVSVLMETLLLSFKNLEISHGNYVTLEVKEVK